MANTSWDFIVPGEIVVTTKDGNVTYSMVPTNPAIVVLTKLLECENYQILRRSYKFEEFNKLMEHMVKKIVGAGILENSLKIYATHYTFQDKMETRFTVTINIFDMFNMNKKGWKTFPVGNKAC